MAFYVEQEDFETELIKGKYEILIKPGIKNVIEIINKKEKEIERLNNIIKEVREYIEEHKQKGYRIPMSDDYEFWNELNENEIKELLEILDKGEDKV